MRIRHLGVFGILTVTSCFQEVESFNESSESLNDNSINFPYPPQPPSNSDIPDKNNNFWECGTDYIITDNPDGTKSVIKVYLNCDPLADIYMGCPMRDTEMLQK